MVMVLFQNSLHCFAFRIYPINISESNARCNVALTFYVTYIRVMLESHWLLQGTIKANVVVNLLRSNLQE